MPVAQISSARTMDSTQRKDLALNAIKRDANITDIAKRNQVSRKFIHAQKNKALRGVDQVFSEASNDRKKEVLFYLPVTIEWIESAVLSLILECKSVYRGAQRFLSNMLDFSISLGTIYNIFKSVVVKAQEHNMQQDISRIKLPAHDEMFIQGDPILSGVDIKSLYCHLLQKETHRDQDTWGIHLLDLQQQGFNPDRVIADDGEGLRNGHKMVLGDVPCDYDHFHITRDLMDLRRFFRNNLKRLEKECAYSAEKAHLSPKEPTRIKHEKLLLELQSPLAEAYYLSTTINTLVSWLEHDVLNMPGASPEVRSELFDFILLEFKNLAALHPHRIKAICTKLENQRENLLAFAHVLDEKFRAIASKHACSLELVWAICHLQRYDYFGDAYHIRCTEIIESIGDQLFDAIEEDVLSALDSTERTSSMVENLNGRVKSYCYNRKGCTQDFLDVLRFYLNHTPFARSAREIRKGKTPTQILTGEQHPHWLEMLGYNLFKRSAA